MSAFGSLLVSKECHDPESLNAYFEFCVLYPKLRFMFCYVIMFWILCGVAVSGYIMLFHEFSSPGLPCLVVRSPLVFVSFMFYFFRFISPVLRFVCF